MKKNTYFIVPAVLLLAGAITLAGCNTQKSNTDSISQSASEAADVSLVPPTGEQPSTFTGAEGLTSRSITVNSSETVSVAPDIAEIVYSVRTENTNASTCHTKNAESVNQVTELLIGLHVDATSIQTTDYYMNPIYSYSQNTQKVVGYEAVTTLTVSDLPIDTLGNLLSQSVQSGVNTIQSISYQSSQYDESYQAALKLAVKSAHTKASVLAEASGATIGKVLYIQENSNYSTARYTDYALTGMMNSRDAMKEMAADESLTVMPGEVAVDVNITVEYQLN